MKKSIGFIGCGKMASAIIKGIQGVNESNNFTVLGSEVNADVAKSASDRLGINVLANNKELAKASDIVFIATKPNYVAEVVEEVKDVLTPEKLVVSIAAGVSTSKIENIIPEIRVIRVMPNTPALVK